MTHVVLASAPDAAAFLTERLGDHASPFLRATAALGLGALREPAGLPCLRRLLADPDSRVRTRAAEGLAYFEDAATDRTLSEAIAADPTSRLARAAQFAREALGSEMVDPGPSLEPASEGAQGSSTESTSAVDEAGAAAPLANLIEEDQILFRLDSDAEQHQIEAARLLEGVGRDDALEPLYVLMTSRSEEVRQAAARAFGAIKSRTREVARRKGKRRGSRPLGTDALTLNLMHRDPAVRLAAASQLGPPDKHLLGVALAQLEREPDVRVQATLVRAVGAIGDASLVPKLTGFLRSADDRVRASAVESLDMCEAGAAFALVMPFLQDPAGRFRANALQSLRSVSGADAEPRMAEMVRAPERWKRDSAAVGLGALGGKETFGLICERLALEQDRHVFCNLLRSFCSLPDAGREARVRELAVRLRQP
ncbi:MAG: HEAT repeat domain-containing protein [Candidatus Wallbacteria bacterium]|nr:HEAT repeat domain-containing protein [Candidatus Wallbacteria bacterium]